MNRWDQERVDTFLRGKAKFHNFELIDDNRLKELEEISIKLKKEYDEKHLSMYSRSYYFLDNYRYGRLSEYTYDELCVIFILMFDKDLSLYNKFIELYASGNRKLDKNNTKKISQLKSELSVDKMNTLYNEAKDLYSFYDDELIKLEKIYFEKYIIKGKLSISFSKEKFKILIYPGIERFSKIEEERLNLLTSLAHKWKKAYKVKNPILLLAYQLEEESDYFSNPSYSEKLIILINAIDSDLELLETYYINSNWNDIKDFAISKFGFFSKQFVLLEKKYNEQYHIISDDPFLVQSKIKNYNLY